VTGVENRTDKECAMARATFAGGCFWGVEDVFRHTIGVTATRVGYIGGSVPNPTSEQVCSDRTGHAEAVEVTYDPDVVSYEDLVEVFFANHDPTQVNRQGPDHGTQYRTAIFTHDASQRTAALAVKERLQKEERYRRPIATQIVDAPEFYQAEDYHQQYFEKRGITHCDT
jgi:peptide-methionine (S)-S-oxide reductase